MGGTQKYPEGHAFSFWRPSHAGRIASVLLAFGSESDQNSNCSSLPSSVTSPDSSATSDVRTQPRLPHMSFAGDTHAGVACPFYAEEIIFRVRKIGRLL